MERCSNCKKKLVYNDYINMSPLDWERVCVKCRELPEIKGKWAILSSQEKSRRDNIIKKLQHSE